MIQKAIRANRQGDYFPVREEDKEEGERLNYGYYYCYYYYCCYY